VEQLPKLGPVRGAVTGGAAGAGPWQIGAEAQQVQAEAQQGGAGTRQIQAEAQQGAIGARDRRSLPLLRICQLAGAELGVGGHWGEVSHA
jgi:hypothetical protein